MRYFLGREKTIYKFCRTKVNFADNTNFHRITKWQRVTDGYDSEEPRAKESRQCRTNAGPSVSVEFDDSRRPSTIDGRRALVNGVVTGQLTEHHAIECKSSLDLASAHGRFVAARAILAFSNREPERSSASFEGFAYLIVGADDQGFHAVDIPSPEELARGLGPYVGTSDGPGWRSIPVSIDQYCVLLVEIDPPQHGQAAWLLRRGFDKVKAGQIYVRRQSESMPPDESEVAMLATRAQLPSTSAPGPHQVRVKLTEQGQRPWFLNTVAIGALQQPIRDRVYELAAEATPLIAGPGFKGHPLTNAVTPWDTARVRAFEDDLLRWAKESSAVLPERLVAWRQRTTFGEIEVDIENRLDKHLDSVTLELILQTPGIAFCSTPNMVRPTPSPPRLHLGIHLPWTESPHVGIAPLAGLHISYSKDRRTAVVSLFDVRQRSSTTATLPGLEVAEAPVDRVVRMEWVLRSKSFTGITVGHLGMVLDPNPSLIEPFLHDILYGG
jgi:hypothetical protein